jgi:hypothetical protein
MKEEEFAAGKSQTCRSSEWQSHCSGRIELRREFASESSMVINVFEGFYLDRSISLSRISLYGSDETLT